LDCCTSSFINFWNDKWCFTTSLTHIAGISDGSSIPNIVSQFWTGCYWNIRFFDHHGAFLFVFYQNGVAVKKHTNLGQVVPTWHDFATSA